MSGTKTPAAFIAAPLLLSLIVAVFLLCKTAPAGAAAPFNPSGLDAALDSAIRENRLVGAVLLIAHDGEIVYRKAVGLADREAGKPMTEDTVFRLASVSKAYTAMAAAALVEQGKLSFNDPVVKWLPYFTPKLPDGEEAEITVAHLLSHTAGLDYGFNQPPDGPYHLAKVSDGLDNSPVSLEENLRRLASAPLLFKPGERWNYSLAIDVLGGVVASAYGNGFAEAMRALVCEPLGLNDSSFVVTDRERLAKPYYNADPEPLPMREEETITTGPGAIHFYQPRIFDSRFFPSGGAGMAGTAGDLLFLLEAIRKGDSPIAGKKVIEQMLRPFTKPDAMGPGSAYALGWGIITDSRNAGTPQAPGTILWGGVYGNSWFVDPENRLSVVLLSNTAFEGMIGKVTTDIREALYREIGK